MNLADKLGLWSYEKYSGVYTKLQIGMNNFNAFLDDLFKDIPPEAFYSNTNITGDYFDRPLFPYNHFSRMERDKNLTTTKPL